MGEEIRKEVTRLLDKWNGGIRLFVVKLVSLAISVWILAGVLSIGIMTPVYLGKMFIGNSRGETNQHQVLLKERLRPRVPRYSRVYEIQGSRVTNRPPLRDYIRETRNTLGELKSISRAVALLGGKG